MSEALVVLNQPTALATGGLGLDGFSLKPAAMKLVQKTTTGDGVIPGKLLDTLSGTHYDSVQVVPLSIRVGRVYFPPSGELGATPICRSDDGIVPSPNAAVPQSPTCATCDHGPKMWAKFKATGIKPDCDERFNILFVTRDSGLPYYLSINGKSITALKKLKDAIYRDVLVAKSKGEARSLFDYTFEIKPVYVQGKKGSYYVLSFINLAKVTNAGEFGPMYAEFVMKQKAHDAALANDDVLEGEIVGETTESSSFTEV
jgi:hypothetical protein